MPQTAAYQLKDSLNSQAENDTVYGIENESSIPVRQIEIPVQKEKPVEQLFDPSPKVSNVESWQIIILVIAVVLVGVVKAFSNNRYKLGLKALINFSVAQEITREEQVLFHRSNIFMSLVHVLTFSLFIYQLKLNWLAIENEQGAMYSFMLIILAVLTIYFVKYSFVKLLLFVFNESAIGSQYIFNVTLYNNLLGALLIPIISISYFTAFPFHNLLTFIVLPLLFIVFLLRVIRLLEIGKFTGMLYVYIFLYICSLEILPLVVLYRIFIR
ncbi:MAG: DUF4271 domain-containing protein [Vicingaceae bacterium]